MIEDVKALVAERKVAYFLCSFVEMSGAPKAKLVPATHLDMMAREGAGFAGFACGDVGRGPHDDDVSDMPEPGWAPYANHHEDANCQFEINWTSSDALTTSDRHTFFKWMVRTVAEQNGLWATFMP